MATRQIIGVPTWIFLAAVLTLFPDGQDPKFRFYDLAMFAPPSVQKTNLGCANIKSQSDYEDRQWERRQQRQVKAEA
jgi:hypothetical protein